MLFLFLVSPRYCQAHSKGSNFVTVTEPPDFCLDRWHYPLLTPTPFPAFLSFVISRLYLCVYPTLLV